ncbi:unnamed protein product [Phaedon cochleariae]|uniref:Uncharacterized protein n=1 Tax=Phaedon cochleariae TaxID=80249 RepID=A0A9N9SIF7_PHACE|nr:unnamed protein product [Phaedon cochleariae]
MKRKSAADLSKIRKKLRKLQKLVDDVDLSSERSVSSSESDMSSGQENNADSIMHASGSESPLDPSSGTNPPPRTEVVTTAQVHVSAEPPVSIDPEILQLLGEDPSNPIQAGVPIPEELTKRWSVYCSSGLDKDTKTQIRDHWPLAPNCPALAGPKLNNEVAPLLKDAAMKQDAFIRNLQDRVGSAMSALGVAINLLMLGNCEQKNDIISPLADCGKFLGEVHFSLANHRRFNILPNVDPNMKKVLEASKVDTTLFGSDLPERLRIAQEEAKSTQKIRIKIKPLQNPNFFHDRNNPRARMKYSAPPPPQRTATSGRAPAVRALPMRTAGQGKNPQNHRSNQRQQQNQWRR